MAAVVGEVQPLKESRRMLQAVIDRLTGVALRSKSPAAAAIRDALAEQHRQIGVLIEESER